MSIILLPIIMRVFSRKTLILHVELVSDGVGLVQTVTSDGTRVSRSPSDQPATLNPSLSCTVANYFSFGDHTGVVVLVVLVRTCCRLPWIVVEESLVNAIGARCQKRSTPLIWLRLRGGSGRCWLILSMMCHLTRDGGSVCRS